MFKEILVPLDGSRLAEVALPVAIHLAQQLEASITLLHVVEANPPAKIHGQPHLATAKAAQAYLKRVANSTEFMAVGVAAVNAQARNSVSSCVSR